MSARSGSLIRLGVVAPGTEGALAFALGMDETDFARQEEGDDRRDQYRW
jgi:hypothetical protein